MKKMISIVYATESGNAENLAEEAQEQLSKSNFDCRCINLEEMVPSDLSEIKVLLAIVSTWGEGDPPTEAEEFFCALQDAPNLQLQDCEFAVLALGDTAYENFCEFGKNLEAHLLRHGATSIIPRVDCDLDFEDPFELWVSNLTQHFESRRELVMA